MANDRAFTGCSAEFSIAGPDDCLVADTCEGKNRDMCITSGRCVPGEIATICSVDYIIPPEAADELLADQFDGSLYGRPLGQFKFVQHGTDDIRVYDDWHHDGIPLGDWTFELVAASNHDYDPMSTLFFVGELATKIAGGARG